MNSERASSAAISSPSAPLAPPVPPGRYRVETSSSRISFRTRHLFGLAPVTGTFAIRSGSVEIAQRAEASVLEAEIDARSFRTGNPQRDRRVRSARFLDTARFGAITFSGDLVSPDGRSVGGMLTVRDVCRPVTLSISQLTVSRQSFTATAAILVDRTEFGVTASPGLAGRFLDMLVEVRCVHQ